MPDVAEGRQRSGALRAAALVAIIGCTAALCYFTMDVPLALWVRPSHPRVPQLVNNILEGAKPFGQGFCVVFTICLVLALDPKRRRDVGLFILVMVVTTLVEQAVKGVCGRIRPWAYVQEMGAFGVSAAPQGGSAWHLFRGFAEPKYGSFPSAHALAAFAMAAVFMRMYPRAAWLFVTTAALCAASRVMDSQHYLSDVIVGGAAGLWMGAGMWRWRWSGVAADWIEARSAGAVERFKVRRGRRAGDAAHK